MIGCMAKRSPSARWCSSFWKDGRVRRSMKRWDFASRSGLPVTLAELGLENLSRETARSIAERAVAVGESAHNEPFEVTAGTLMDAIYAADSMGVAFKARASS